MSKENNENKSDSDLDQESLNDETLDSELILEKIGAKAITFLDNIVNSYEKQALKDKSNEIVQKAKNSEKFSKSKRKTIVESNETSLNEPETEPLELDFASIKEQYGYLIEMLIMLANPYLTKNGIEPITRKEIDDLIDAIFDLAGSYFKKMSSSVGSSIKVMKNFRKIINLIRAFYQLIAPRIIPISNTLKKIQAKKESKQKEAEL